MNSSFFNSSDVIETHRHSLIHHGPQNKRVYVMHLDPQDMPAIIDELEELATTNHYTKMIYKVPKPFKADFSKRGYKQEGSIPKYFSAIETCCYMCHYLDARRKQIKDIDQVTDVLRKSLHQTSLNISLKLQSPFTIKILDTSHTFAMAELYRQVFSSYPFPIFDKTYLEETMLKNIIYFGLFNKNQLVGVASCETDLSTKTSEMTDFAIHPDYRGHQFALHLLQEMEIHMRMLGIQTVYTIARANSYGMNITFTKQGYCYGGLLRNNTHIGGQLESMNVWYKMI
ncbi:putative beta-lysine N-acetyltransferase [Cellulosilyticum lentocellum]|uniref:Putative beta-lysine N-acetyltransferase n=1 Tax=Cellulosilyticum lentocellum (strain ATCC 49066 / DSM 5427 / NCIMB 11756 / RHM5) TaxID=642492 RepID=F2JSB4_CELLD|nr:putative beta-lysine N-acetyltransferase [Cellulosilyticum lentocellum]ADZ85152.1 putative beta-lysine N-acetyltransferase [Cellulosilyticum lentocellum DSM 5427]